MIINNTLFIQRWTGPNRDQAETVFKTEVPRLQAILDAMEPSELPTFHEIESDTADAIVYAAAEYGFIEYDGIAPFELHVDAGDYAAYRRRREGLPPDSVAAREALRALGHTGRVRMLMRDAETRLHEAVQESGLAIHAANRSIAARRAPEYAVLRALRDPDRRILVVDESDAEGVIASHIPTEAERGAIAALRVDDLLTIHEAVSGETGHENEIDVIISTARLTLLIGDATVWRLMQRARVGEQPSKKEPSHE